MIVLGLIGWIMPVIPGFPLTLIGLSLIAPRFAKRLKLYIYHRFFKKPVLLFEEWLKNGIYAGITTRHLSFFIGKTEEFLDLDKQQKLKSLISNDPVLKQHRVPLVSQYVFLNQVHGDTVAVLDDAAIFDQTKFIQIPEADAVITNLSDTNLLVLTADCLSVYFWARDWVGLAHAGWRGTEKEITAKTYKLIRERSGCDQVKVIFGPCIRRKNYEVGEEFRSYFKHSLISREGKLFFDLAAENKRQLLETGLSETDLFDLEACTINDNEAFYSFRKEKDKSGRMISFISKNSKVNLRSAS